MIRSIWKYCKACREPMIGVPQDANTRDKHNCCGGKSKVVNGKYSDDS